MGGSREECQGKKKLREKRESEEGIAGKRRMGIVEKKERHEYIKKCKEGRKRKKRIPEGVKIM